MLVSINLERSSEGKFVKYQVFYNIMQRQNKAEQGCRRQSMNIQRNLIQPSALNITNTYINILACEADSQVFFSRHKRQEKTRPMYPDQRYSPADGRGSLPYPQQAPYGGGQGFAG